MIIRILSSIQFAGILVLLVFLFSYCDKEKEAELESVPITVSDIDGNVYNTITINGVIWMVENLKTTRYRNGDTLVHVTDPEGFYNSLFEGAFANYNNDPINSETYGRLYNWWAINDERKIAPEGWHVATNAEWQALVDFLGGEEIAGGKLKETGVDHWKAPNTGAYNEVGFTALPGGYVLLDDSFENIGYHGLYWTSTREGDSGHYAKSWTFSNTWTSIFSHYYSWAHAASVRCIMD